MSKIEEEEDSENPPSQINQIIRTNNYLINRIDTKSGFRKKSKIPRNPRIGRI